MQFDYKILVIDNSGGACTELLVAPDVKVLVNPENVGLANSYNSAISYCLTVSACYLVTLDQDSVISADYLEEISRSLVFISHVTVALCPRVLSGCRLVSPFYFNRLGLPRYGDGPEYVCAINSFTVYSVEYLVRTGGFDEYYWLDALDLHTGLKIRGLNCTMKVLNVTVSHNLSLVSGGVSCWRMINILRYESCFLFECCGWLHVISGQLRLIVRAFLFVLRGQRWHFLWKMFQAIGSGAVMGFRRRVKFMDSLTEGTSR
jgi:GT2 family glycosyltransferase